MEDSMCTKFIVGKKMPLYHSMNNTLNLSYIAQISTTLKKKCCLDKKE